jgi:hypothetical protein
VANVLDVVDVSGRDRCWSAVLFALPWPLPVYAVVGSLFIVINERVLGVHFFDASSLADGAALASMLGAASWSDWQDRHSGGRPEPP